MSMFTEKISIDRIQMCIMITFFVDQKIIWLGLAVIKCSSTSFVLILIKTANQNVVSIKYNILIGRF